MKELMVLQGNPEELRQIVREYVERISGLIIDESGGESTFTYLKYGGITVKYSFQVIFLGYTTHYLISFRNLDTNDGACHVLEGDWDPVFVMSSLYTSIFQCFRTSTFKYRRGIHKGLGELIYTILAVFDGQYTENLNNNEITAHVKLDRHEVLIDLEWIEEIMENSELGD